MRIVYPSWVQTFRGNPQRQEEEMPLKNGLPKPDRNGLLSSKKVLEIQRRRNEEESHYRL